MHRLSMGGGAIRRQMYIQYIVIVMISVQRYDSRNDGLSVDVFRFEVLTLVKRHTAR